MAVLHYNFHSHPKIVGLPLATVGAFALALSYCSANLTDGFVPIETARDIDPKGRHFDRLVQAGLIAPAEPNGGQTAAKRRPSVHDEHSQTARGFVVTDYLDYNPSKTQVEQKRKEARARMNRVRANKPAQTPNSSHEQNRDVHLNVRDIGKDNPLTSKANVTSTPAVTQWPDVEGFEGPGSVLSLLDRLAERRTSNG